MLVGEGDELDALVPEELRKDEQGLVDMGAAEGKGTAPRLRPRPVRQLRPDDSVSDAVSPDALRGASHDPAAFDGSPQLSRVRELREFEGGVYAL